MSALHQEDRERVLRDLSQMGASGQAERESPEDFRRRFYPVAEHSRALEPDVVLIVGERGAGKSELFRAVVQENLLAPIVRFSPNSRLARLDLDKTRWLEGHPLGQEFPDNTGLRRFIEQRGDDSEAIMDLWFAYLARVLGTELSGVTDVTSVPGGDSEGVMSAFQRLGNRPLLALDKLDKKLEAEERWCFVSYDELDTLGGYDWNAMACLIRGLISFWASYSRRWNRVRAKIFLRTDLFRRYGQILGADLIKLASNRAEIVWSDRNLYAMLVKRIANTSDLLKKYSVDSRLSFDTDPLLGSVPRLSRAEDARPLIERMVGPYMGADIKKGRSFTWLLNHVRDGNGRAMPRALVRLIEEGATQEIHAPRATHSRLLDPRSLRRALDKVSEEHVLQVHTNELPWLPGVANRLRGEEVPMLRRDAEKRLAKEWDKRWGQKPEVRPPVDSPAALMDYLVDLGVLRVRAGSRIDAPDLFLAGLGLKRKGGVVKR